MYLHRIGREASDEGTGEIVILVEKVDWFANYAFEVLLPILEILIESSLELYAMTR